MPVEELYPHDLGGEDRQQLSQLQGACDVLAEDTACLLAATMAGMMRDPCETRPPVFGLPMISEVPACQGGLRSGAWAFQMGHPRWRIAALQPPPKKMAKKTGKQRKRKKGEDEAGISPFDARNYPPSPAPHPSSASA